MLIPSSRPLPVRLARLLAGCVAAGCILGSALGPLPAKAATTETFIAPTGESPDDAFGTSVSDAGDVNGDGYGDIIVGAKFNGEGGLYAGRAYVYYGGPAADLVADLVLTGESALDSFGSSVSGAGDINGDGYDDVIVGAPDYGSSQGRAYVFHGGPGADSIADLVLTGESPGDQFGCSVSGAGDVDADGYEDVIVGAKLNDAGGDNAGRVYLYRGGPGADSIADLVLAGESGDVYFGYSVSAAGDVDDDGYEDVIVGATFHAGDAIGHAYVYYGGPGVDAIADLVLTGESANDNFGISVSGAGDVSGDGVSDIIVGASGYGVTTGHAYVYRGGSDVDSVPDLVLTGESVGDAFGISVSGAGDVDGDGYGDIVVGASENSAGGYGAGRVFVYLGGPAPDSVPDLVLTGDEVSNHFGVSASGVGDINGDGFDDVLAGAPGNDVGGDNSGRAYVYMSYPYHLHSPSAGEQWVAGNPTTVRWRGRDLADLAISYDAGATWLPLATGIGGETENLRRITAPAAPTDFAKLRMTYTGQQPNPSTSVESDGVFSIVLPVDPPPAAHRLHLAPTGESNLDSFGSSVSSAGDVNGDGHEDFLVGAETNGAGGADAGRAYLFYGGPGGDTQADLVLTGEAAFDRFGASVAGAGDLNGDGFDDIIVGAYGSDAGGDAAGRAYVYLGGASVDSAADFVLTGEAASDNFGVSVAVAGDVNGDGFSDVLVGAHGNDAGGTDAGRAYVYFGGPGADAVADLILTGEAAFDRLGRSVAAAGDIDGDGYDDIIVGANLNDAGGDNAGRAYIYLGGPGADSIADIVLTGEAAGDNFGLAVSGAGDVDGDGYDDVIVGGYASAVGGTNAGRAYVYRGGPGADGIADLVFTGEAGELLGVSVAGAGDVGGDGYDDLVVGAWGSDAGGPGSGRVYVYYGGPGADAAADLVLTGEAAGDVFGGSVCGAGDVNNDGCDDLIVGAEGNDTGGVSAGRAYLYDCARYFLTSPAPGSTWNVGAIETISWLGAEPADLWLSVDGGRTLDLLRTGVGGSASNGVELRVPHAPTRFAQLLLTPAAGNVSGRAESDSLFTIEAAIGLLALRVESPETGPSGASGASGATVTWRTNPGPDDLEGYRLERAAGSPSANWRPLVLLTRETSYHDVDAASGDRYRLTAINGLGEEYVLGEVSFGSTRPLSAWPVPYRGETLHVAFATLGGFAQGKGRTDVALFDVAGRRVRTIVAGDLDAGNHAVTWDGRDESGDTVSEGIYFLRMTTAGTVHSVKVTIIQ